MAERMNENYIRLFRKMTNWEWYRDSKTKALFIHCLLRASWAPYDWHGIHCEAGQFVTSIAKLAEETGLSVQETRTALAHLLATRDITQEATKSNGAKCSLITVNNWAKYQGATQEATRTATQKEAHLLATRGATREATKGDGAECALITANNWAKYQGATQEATRTATTGEEYKKKGGPSRGSAAPEKEADSPDEWEWEDASVLRERMRKEHENEGTV